ncbi:murein biosynthesis integral membrane protein MurJ [Bdellovibrionota bacterium FG-1]
MTSEAGKNRSGGHAVLVASGILLSRLAGLVRERVFAHYLGNSNAAGAFRAALRIPNFLQNLFGEGVLSASFIPVYSRLLSDGEADDRQMAARVAGVVGAVLSLWVSGLVLVGVLLTPYLVGLVAPGFQGEIRELTVRIVRILFPGVGVLVLSAWCLGVLNSHRKFFLSYAAPVLWNLAMILTLVFFGARGVTEGDLAVALAWGTVVGSVLQFAVQLPFVFKYAPRIRWALDTQLAPVRQVFRNLGPVVLSRGVVQLSAYIDGMIASFLGAAAVSGLGYAQTIYLLPIGLFGMSVAAAELPAMSQASGRTADVHSMLCARLVAGQRKIAFFVVPSVVGFLVLGRGIVAALYQTGQFGGGDTLYVWYILMGSTIGLLAATWGRLLSSTFYAVGDTRTLFRFAVLRVVLTASLGVLFAFPFRPAIDFVFVHGLHLPKVSGGAGELGMGAVGLTASAGIAGWIEFILLRAALARRIGPARVPGEYQLRVWGAAILAGMTVFLSARISMVSPVMTAVWEVGCFGVAYLMLSILLRVPEVLELLKRVQRKG